MDKRFKPGNLRLDMPRLLQPELLDTLSPQHPDAMHSRRDQRLVNRVMGNHRWFARTLPSRLRPGEQALELGAGNGELIDLLSRGPVAVDGLDLWPPPDSWPTARRWHRADLREFTGYRSYAAVLGNMIFHHFPDHQLTALGHKLRQHARLIMACEPVRRGSSQLLFRFIATLLGANHVTLHDAHVSIAAGFVDDELPRLLGLDSHTWHIQSHRTLLGAYRMIATRRD